MGIFDILRRKKNSENIVRITRVDPTTGKTIWSVPVTSHTSQRHPKPQKPFRISKCKECGRSVRHTCISERRKTIDVGGMESISQIWAISNHKYGNGKCRGSNRRYKKQFIK